MSDYNFYSQGQKKKNTAKIALVVIAVLAFVSLCFGAFYLYLYSGDKECKYVKYRYNVLNSDSSVNEFINETVLSDCDGEIKSSSNLFVTNVSKDSDKKVTISYDAGLNSKSGERTIILPAKEKLGIDKSAYADDNASPMKLNMTLEISDKYNEFKSKICNKFNLSSCVVNITLRDWSIEENNIVITKDNLGEYKNYLLKYGTKWIMQNMNFSKSNRLYSSIASIYANISSTLKPLISDASYVEEVSEFLNRSVQGRILNNSSSGLSAVTCLDIEEMITNIEKCGAACENELGDDFISKLEKTCGVFDSSYVSDYTLKSSFTQLSPYVSMSLAWKSHSNDREFLETTSQIINDFLSDSYFSDNNLYDTYLTSDASVALNIISKNADACGSTCATILSSTLSKFNKYLTKKADNERENVFVSGSNYLTGEEVTSAAEEDYYLLWLDGNSLKRQAYLLYETDNKYTSAQKQSVLLYSYYNYINNRYKDTFKYYGAYNVADTALELYKYTKNPIYLDEVNYIYKNGDAMKYNGENAKDNGLIGYLSYISFYNNYKDLNNLSSDDMMSLVAKNANRLLSIIDEQPEEYGYTSIFTDSYLLNIISTL